MRVLVRHVGARERRDAVEWPEGWPIPREGDSFEIRDAREVTTVRNVTWYPEGKDDNAEPFVYVVVGPRRPS